jgi:8-amino-7-oxononanoate synthase
MALDRGLYVNIVLPPACHADACVLRTSYSAAHTEAEINRAVTIFAEVGRALSVIPAFA